ncbi:hypothetical protein ACFPRL_28635 [Pseudoclavibacter helvolus]
MRACCLLARADYSTLRCSPRTARRASPLRGHRVPRLRYSRAVQG